MDPMDPPAEGIDRLTDAVRGGGVVLLTGAGMSTDSGIPDYRGPGAVDRRPMTYADFTGSEAARQRYWARSHVGWRRMTRARPNPGHHALAWLETAGMVTAIVTQNVDRLHVEAGSRHVVELHGRIDEVVCLDCRAVTTRDELDQRLAALNPGWGEDIAEEAPAAPDGDAVLDDVADFHTAACRTCGGTLKPHLVFFGENVPLPRVERAAALVDAARTLIVAGSSLTVFSGRRFAARAAARGIPVIVVNRGPTRWDDRADLRVDAGCSQTFQAVLAAVAGAVAAAAVCSDCQA